MRFDTLSLTTNGHIATIELTRSDLGNPIDAHLLDEIDAAAAMIHDDDNVHVVLLTATGSAFSVGTPVGTPSPFTGRALPFRSLELMAQPVIAVIDGGARGAGLELALACDMRVASAQATFAMPQLGEGDVPSGGGTQRLSRLIGRARAAEMILLGTEIDAAAALACGLVNHVAGNGPAARAEAERLAGRIAAQGPIAVRYAKEAILRGLDLPLDAALRYETDLTVILQTTADRAEGVAAFLAKRPRQFEGR